MLNGGSTNIVNFITTRADVLVLGFGHIGHTVNMYFMGLVVLLLGHVNIGHIVFHFF